MDIRERIGKRIKELRKEIPVTQEVLAFNADLDKTYVNEVENGKRNISVINLEKIIHALNCNISDFFNHNLFNEEVKK